VWVFRKFVLVMILGLISVGTIMGVNLVSIVRVIVRLSRSSSSWVFWLVR